MVEANITGLGATHVAPQGMGYVPQPYAHVSSLLDYFPKVYVDSHELVFANEISPDGGVAAVSENNAKPLTDADIAASKQHAAKYAGIVTCSLEMIDDIPFMENLIRTKLMREVKNAVSTAFMTALNAATPTLADTDLTAGTTGTLLADIPPAVTEDMQIKKGYTPYLWLLDSPNYAKLFAQAKVSNLWYAMNDPIIKACAQVGDTKIVGLDPMMFPLYIYKDINVTIGRSGDDFKYNRVTIRGEARVSWNMAGNCLNAIYNDVISDTLTAIL